ncbi:serine hydrolase [Chryseobacterium sp. BIGb0232]|uniref:serine hydrolase n=1 Tax=Chryseobacterium sp. BIGb0232 TaxID=2940598 RepID=UPI000F4760C9|nr:serine hydrolase [Chryseobacterium sp. BIGb0232]MCS4301250.1 CubicO group peptidase (beta-lactamase class C family) [Chryseobacterium sp. BIGb0232]ROS19890.1 CubicO group peptidase (beta-lactamase class C family) [Chryseobacterium nakagawai]
MEKVLYLVSLLSFSLMLSQKPKENLKGLDQEINDILDNYKAVGLSVAIVKNDSMIYSKGFGYRDYENKLPVTSNTLFGIGSNTKSFTSALIGMLEDGKKLSVQDKPSQHIPYLTFSTDRMNNLITIEDLLEHRSGLGSVDGAYIFFPSEKRVDLMQKLPFLKENGEPKNSWRYSNFGYIILGTIAEQLNHKDWDELIKEKIFVPLKMNSSSTSINEMIKQKDFSYPYGMYQKSIERVLFQKPDNDKPGAAINSSATDMANWIRLWLSYGTFENQVVLSKKYTTGAMSTKTVIDGVPPVTSDQKNFLLGYGYGWFTQILKGHYKVWHSGGVSGFSSAVLLFPAEKFGLVVLSNQHNSDIASTIGNMIAIRMLGLDNNTPYSYEMEVNDILKPKKNISSSINEKKKPTHDLEAYCGEYSNKGYGTFTISKEKNNLYITFPTFKFILVHQRYELFSSKIIEEVPQQMNPDFDFNFILDDKGNVNGVTMDIQGGTIFKKTK